MLWIKQFYFSFIWKFLTTFFPHEQNSRYISSIVTRAYQRRHILIICELKTAFFLPPFFQKYFFLNVNLTSNKYFEVITYVFQWRFTILDWMTLTIWQHRDFLYGKPFSVFSHVILKGHNLKKKEENVWGVCILKYGSL